MSRSLGLAGVGRWCARRGSNPELKRHVFRTLQARLPPHSAMPIVLLTEHGRGVRPATLPIVPGKRASYHDASTPGLMVRVTPNGIRTYYVWMRVANGRPRLVRIGDVRVVSLAKARQTARHLLDGARAGVDPRDEKRRAQAEAQQASLQPQSLREMAERYLAEGRTKRGRPLGPASVL